MSEQRQAVWTVDDVQRVAAEEGIPLEGGGFSVSGCLTHPDGMSRAGIVAMLRMLVGTPSDDRIEREVEATRNDPDAWEAEAIVHPRDPHIAPLGLDAIRLRLNKFREIRDRGLANPAELYAQVTILDNDVEALVGEVTQLRAILLRVAPDGPITVCGVKLVDGRIL